MEFMLSFIEVFLVVGWQHAYGYSLTNATDSVLGCSHNNTRFANGSFVPTVEPCLSCKCLNANLICALRVCPEQALPPPRGCAIVQKKNACCPYMTCSKFAAHKDQEKSVITHDRKWYEQNIRNRIFSQNALQRRIEDDSDKEPQLSNGKMCVYNGTVYRSGSAMTTSSLCTYCYCIEGKEKCIQPKCTLPTKGCEPILIDSSCCPIRYDCTDKKTIKARYNTKYNRRRNDNKHYLRMTSRMQRSRGCLVDSIFYPEGHKLPANQTNPCEICFCIGGSKRCAPKKCAPIIKNCKPIIPDGQCCPSSYDCNHKSARGFTPRQYSDFFSLLFGEEDKEKVDYESETESMMSTEFNATNEQDLLDAIKDSLNFVDENKQTAERQTNVPNKTDLFLSNAPSYNASDDEDDEEISLLDFFLKGESAFTSTTLKPFELNVTSKPLLNGMTNSPMHIQPILPENMKNESLKFSMLPMSLYNMVNDEGSLIFPQLKTSHPLEISSDSKIKETKNDVTTKTSEFLSSSDVQSDIKTTINSAEPTATTERVIETSTVHLKLKNFNNPNVQVSNQPVNLNITQNLNVKKIANKIVTTTPKATEDTINKTISSSTLRPKPANSSKSSASTTETIISATAKPIPKKPTIVTKTITSTITTTTKRPIEITTVSLQSLTTTSSQTTSALPKITAVQISSNPSILESLDYSEPTLPPSLPNLKIIPFLPTDAVKNIINKNDAYKPNYNYYQPTSDSYASSQTHTNSSAYSPFNIKPTVEKYPLYNENLADDRIDYDTYKVPGESLDSSDYINVYSGNGNVIQPTTFQVSVNSKLDYESNDQKVVPSKVQNTPNKNLTVKPPLPPFEPEHEYNLYNLPPQPLPQLQPENIYDEYNVPNYSPEYNYNVPHFVNMPPIKESSHRPDSNKDSVFSYGNKNKFVPPEKTEGGFVPKRTPGENYIPLRGSNYFAENVDNKVLTSLKNSTLAPMDNHNHTTNIVDKHTDDSFKPTEEYNDALLGVDILGPYKKQSDEYDLTGSDVNRNSTFGANENSISFNQLYGVLFADGENATTSTISATPITEKTNISTPIQTNSVTAPKTPLKNMTSNAIPLKLITILNNTKKESPTKIEIPQRKNNKIIDPTDEPLVEDTNMPSVTTEMTSSTKTNTEKNDNLTILRDVFLSSLSRPSIGHEDISEELLHKTPVFLTRPINKLSPSFISSASFPSLNSLESKHNFQTNPIRSELDLIITELNKNKQTNDFSHTNNFNSENYQVLHAVNTNIANTESYVVNPVSIDKLNGETEIFTPPHKDPAGLLKLAGCNIYGRMYRVGRIIAELSSSCLECRCTEVGVSCTPLNC